MIRRLGIRGNDLSIQQKLHRRNPNIIGRVYQNRQLLALCHLNAARWGRNINHGRNTSAVSHIGVLPNEQPRAGCQINKPFVDGNTGPILISKSAKI